MDVSAALTTDQAEALGIAVLVVVVVVGIVVLKVISAIVGRVIAFVLMVALAAVVWTQRADIEAAAKNCDATFFGVHLTPSDPDLKAKCQDVTNR